MALLDICKIQDYHRKAISLAMDILKDEIVYLIGIRDIRNVDSFNDEFILYSPYGDILMLFNEFTTDPGIYYLREPISIKGTAILMEGAHRGIWSFGLHKGRYRALVQVNSCCVYRDANKDDIINMNTNTRDCGFFGINLHHGYNSYRVGKNSAGCQVFRREEDLNSVLGVLSGRFSFLKSFSYYLYRKV